MLELKELSVKNELTAPNLPLSLASEVDNGTFKKSEWYNFASNIGKIIGTVGPNGEDTPNSYPLDRFVNYLASFIYPSTPSIQNTIHDSIPTTLQKEFPFMPAFEALTDLPKERISNINKDEQQENERKKRLEKELLYTNSPGRHTKLSPVVGSRQHELNLIFEHKEIFSEYQKVIYKSQHVFVIPIAYKELAENIAKKMFSSYIENHKQSGLTIENAVEWNVLEDSLSTRVYLSDLENEWNTWKVKADVGVPESPFYVKSTNKCLLAYISAIHEIMHVEETPIGISEKEYAKFHSIAEVLTATKTIILLDQVYKEVLDLPLEDKIDYGLTFNFFGKEIPQGKFANFYRDLEEEHENLAQALVSKESLKFLGVPYHYKNKL